MNILIAYKGLPRKVWLLAATMLINRIGTMVIAFLSVYATQELHFSIQQAGFLLMFFGLGSISGAWLGGYFGDRIGYYKVQFVSLFVGGLWFFVVSIIDDYHFLCTAIFILSIFGEAYRPANTASIAEFSTPSTATRSYSLVRLAVNLGWAVGPVLGGFLATISYKYLFWVDGLTNIAAAFMVLAFLKTNKKTTSKKAKIEAQVSVWKDTYFMKFIFYTTLYGIIFFSLFTIIPVYYKQILHYSEQEIGILMGVNGLCVAVFEMFIIYKLEHKFTKIQFILMGAILVILNYLIFYFCTSFLAMLIGIMIATLSEIFAMPFMNSLSVERAGEARRGAYAGMYSMAWSCAQVLAPLLATQTIAAFGYSALWIVFGTLGSIAAFGFYSLRKES